MFEVINFAITELSPVATGFVLYQKNTLGGGLLWRGNCPLLIIMDNKLFVFFFKIKAF